MKVSTSGPGGRASDLEDVEALVVELGVGSQQDRRAQRALQLVEDRPLLPLQRARDVGVDAQQQLAQLRPVAQAGAASRRRFRQIVATD